MSSSGRIASYNGRDGKTWPILSMQNWGGVHISELLDVEAALAGRVLAELCEQRLRVTEPGHVIQSGCGLAGRKADKRHVALAPAVVPVVEAAEAYD